MRNVLPLIAVWLLVENGVVTNRVVWDGDAAKWRPPANATVVQDDGRADIGGTQNADGSFSPPGE